MYGMSDEYETLLLDYRRKKDFPFTTTDRSSTQCLNGKRCKYKRVGICKFDHSKDDMIRCNHCGRDGHITTTCPDAICFVCGGKGHIATTCPVRERRFARMVATEMLTQAPTVYTARFRDHDMSLPKLQPPPPLPKLQPPPLPPPPPPPPPHRPRPPQLRLHTQKPMPDFQSNYCIGKRKTVRQTESWGLSKQPRLDTHNAHF
jgi:hypothetical protein